MATLDPSHKLKLCSICQGSSNPNYLTVCDGCGKEDVCEGCSLRTEDENDVRCFACAVPYCRDCGWEGRSTKELDELVLPEESFCYDVCPVCKSPFISPIVSGDLEGPTEIPDVFKEHIKEIFERTDGV